MSRQDEQDNRCNQLNPNNDTYWSDRGWSERPDDWQDRARSGDTEPDED